MKKTNAMRMLDRANVPYQVKEYVYDESNLSGLHVALDNNLPVELLFKTIVLKGNKTGFIVVCLQADKEIDLKKAAKLSQNKSVEPLHVKDLEKTTGYIRGGCSPIGMKKVFPVYADISMKDKDKIYISAGLRGLQLVMKPSDLIDYCSITLGNVIKD